MTAPTPTPAAEVLPPQMVQQADNPTPRAEAQAGDEAAAGRGGVGALVSPARHRARSALSVTIAGAVIAGLFVFANNALNRHFDSLEASINLTNARIDRLEVKIDALDDRMEVKIDALDDRMDALAADMAAVLAILMERGDTGAVPEARAAGA